MLNFLQFYNESLVVFLCFFFYAPHKYLLLGTFAESPLLLCVPLFYFFFCFPKGSSFLLFQFFSFLIIKKSRGCVSCWVLPVQFGRSFTASVCFLRASPGMCN